MKAFIVLGLLYLSICTCQVVISPDGSSRQCVVDRDLQEQLMIIKCELQRTTKQLTEQLNRTTEQLSRITGEQRTTKEQLQKLKRKVKKITEGRQDVVEIKMAGLEEQVTEMKEQIQQLINGKQKLAGIKTDELDKQAQQLTNGSQNPAVQLTYGSCADLPEATPSGIYNITPASGQMLPVYCDMVTDGGGWTVFQRRQDGSENFTRNWTDYKHGFGKLDGEFWLGNEALALITSQRPYELRVDMEAFDGRKRYAVYSNFSVAPSADKYRLSLGNYTGNAGDSLAFHNGDQFSTYDQDNDWSTTNCAADYKGAWWFWGCSLSHLNGLYLGEGRTPEGQGVLWHDFTGLYSSLKYSAMKIRPH